MRFIDHLRSDPICFDGDTDKVDYDVSRLIAGTTVFDVAEIAEQLIESSTETVGENYVPRVTYTNCQ
jgi:hypothetical protein